ncbi:hypothetical protein ACH4HG_22325 [Streptomyces coeruleorubidus]|uniref:Uncharacterized protein n=1 Tax=Streptomyces coeruleorubidus TaxID=116188 RepID=A0ABZ0KLH7_STRC4|nr:MULTISPECIES: hypothetical protein [Streptomyces]WOT38793.1 hypothetical protein R5U08_33625 [Streptomyces coeruleorubidus]
MTFGLGAVFLGQRWLGRDQLVIHGSRLLFCVDEFGEGLGVMVGEIGDAAQFVDAETVDECQGGSQLIFVDVGRGGGDAALNVADLVVPEQTVGGLGVAERTAWDAQPQVPTPARWAARDDHRNDRRP